MPNIRKPRKGSMQYWPRKRAKKETARVRSWAKSKEVKILGFAGYKAGMTHVIATENRTKSKSKGEEISLPVTIIECPPIKVAGVRFYKTGYNGKEAVSDVLSDKLDKELGRRISMPKKFKNKIDDVKDYEDLVLLIYTQPKATGIGKKRPELFEVAIGGSKDEKLAYAKEKIGSEIKVEDVFKEGDQVDIHAVTIGKGNQGPVKRFGIALRSHKSEKTIRGPGSLGGWKGQAHVMYRVAYSGQTGYHLRTEYNKQILKIGNNPDEIKIKGGIPHFGFVKSQFILLKGSLAGPKKRLIRFNMATRPNKGFTKDAPAIKAISLESKQ